MSEEEFELEWNSTNTKVEHRQTIMMTHVGMYFSATSIDRMFRYYLGGSKTLDKHFQQNSKELLLWIHGHTHNGVGMLESNLKPILNPGSISLGRFAMVQLRRK